MTHTFTSSLLTPLTAQTSFWDALWFRENASDYAEDFNAVFYFIFWISMLFFVVLMALMVWYMIKYKRRPGVAAEVSPSHNTPLEIAWSVIPAIGFAVMFFWGTWVYLPKTVVPEGAETINVTAKQWAWGFEYPNGASSLQTEIISDVEQPVFAIPAGRPVKFLLSSTDVIHSFYIPELRIKRDCFPNRYTVAWAEAREATHYFDPSDGLAKPYDTNNDGDIDDGEQGFYLYCTEYCGDQHSQMTNRIVVLDEPDYQAWLEAQADTSSIPLVELGATLYKTAGCVACHSVDGSKGTGPTWQGVWNEDRPGYQPDNRDENPQGRVDFQYIRESILEPNVYMHPNYPQGGMNSYQGQLDEREIRALATYIKSLTAEFADEAQADSQAELEGGDGGSEGETTETQEDGA